MALTAHTTLFFVSGKTLDVVETIAQVWAAAPQNMTFPAGAALSLCAVPLTLTSGATISVLLRSVERMEPK